METLYDRLIQQLDTLVPFLALSHKQVFDLIHRDNEEWFPEKQKSTLPDTLLSYQTQIAHSAFLLGYSYFEAFIRTGGGALLFDFFVGFSQTIPGVLIQFSQRG